ncbi:hypothetical protein AA103196_2259 [Ameyamaea chiangmaiensis NBRC 103196]|uniref:Uncharacterized protein n=1 Tax=Ameyamaea chiangmaiensis TaxID=442969 RepID=A0A850P9K5_9PROT|nr:hypothetical protein [Ameyamaea chiangmaiensis]MBS4075482.1 hypothetical protein [Ameyamaea chiangmaiensis]NVN38986.1 hypothetical protein [Ameyamaea chiangmaiensis]GBQ69607.1 hypothetical protein AA103196_2259 [Ameyamaea chiangmaiensis NBRC 103196]
MELYPKRVFQRQLKLQAEFIIISSEQINSALKERDVTKVFYSIQNFLNASANIAKCLFGSGGRKCAQRKSLRESIGVDENSPFKNVSARNNFEHMDERIDRWWGESRRHNLCDLNITPAGFIQGFETVEWFRNFDPETTDITFFSEKFNLQEIVDEVQRIYPKLQEEAGKPHWE